MDNGHLTVMANLKSQSVTAASLPLAMRASHLWASIFALSALIVVTLQPSMALTLLVAGVLSLVMLASAHFSIAQEKFPNIFYQAISFIAPVQFAFLIWLAVYLGRDLTEGSFVLSSIAAFAALAAIIAVDAVLSIVVLMAAQNKNRTSGLSIASLINAKYAGLLGSIK